MIVQHNIMSINAHRQLGVNNTALSKKLAKLSSGYRVNVAADDAAGLAISEKMRKQITGLSRAVLNAHDGVSLVQTAEGALQEVHAQLNRLEEMAVQASNGIYAAEDRQMLQAETNALLEEFDRISKASNFNGIKLLDGSLSKDKSIAAAAKALTPPPYATPMALSVMSAFGIEGTEETLGIQPLGGGIGTLSVETIDFNNLMNGQSGTGWSFNDGVLTIDGSGNTYNINGTNTETTNRILVANGTNCGITLNNVNISASTGAALDMRGATVTLNLEGTSTLKTTGEEYAGVQTTGGTLTIEGTTGKLTAQGSRYGAGIGGGKNGACGNITINGGTVEAQGSDYAAGIGGGYYSDGGTININGGTVEAQGGLWGAGIGGGAYGDGGIITISGNADVTATGGNCGAGIGSGNWAWSGSPITITISDNANVTATGKRGGAGIGGGDYDDGGTIIINGGTVEAQGSDYAAGISPLFQNCRLQRRQRQ